MNNEAGGTPDLPEIQSVELPDLPEEMLARAPAGGIYRAIMQLAAIGASPRDVSALLLLDLDKHELSTWEEEAEPPPEGLSDYARTYRAGRAYGRVLALSRIGTSRKQVELEANRYLIEQVFNTVGNHQEGMETEEAVDGDDDWIDGFEGDFDAWSGGQEVAG